MSIGSLESLHENVKFTYEGERDGEIAFLDIMIKRSTNGVQTSVYRKET